MWVLEHKRWCECYVIDKAPPSAWSIVYINEAWQLPYLLQAHVADPPHLAPTTRLSYHSKLLISLINI